MDRAAVSYLYELSAAAGGGVVTASNGAPTGLSQGPSPGLATEEASDTDLSSGGRTLTFGTFENGLFFFKNFPDCVCVT